MHAALALISVGKLLGPDQPCPARRCCSTKCCHPRHVGNVQEIAMSGQTESKATRIEQVQLPSLHANLKQAIARDYGPYVDPSTPVFLRAYAFGFCAQAGPQLLGVVVSLVLQTRKGLSKLYLKRLARKIAAIFREAAGRRGLGLLFGASLGGAKYLEARLIPLLRWIKRKRRPQDVTAPDEDQERRIKILATFLATVASTWFAFALQTPLSTSSKHSAASDLPLVALYDPVKQRDITIAEDPTITFHDKRYSSPTLDFTLFLLVRAVDTSLRAVYTDTKLAKNKLAQLIAAKGDVVLFVLSAWRIMFVWFYKPWLLPPEYNE